uniref:Cadherin-related midgut membrane protein n=1 Tax=Lymantria xylina TaxID=78901 RepID=A0A5J6YFN8_LYMXY|nr:cadherin-related midgut membrane protein [Lymantria xylina]
MATDVCLVTIGLIILAANIAFAQELCGYMEQIPRPSKPEFPDQNFEGLTWRERPLLPAEVREDLCMDEFHIITTNSGTQLIYMEEEIEGDVVIAKLNYHGSNTPYIVSPFFEGSFNMLMPVIRRIPEQVGDWHLVITQRQDYETPGMQLYMFNVRVDDETMVAGVLLRIVNIDDNAPIVQVFEPCSIPETAETDLVQCRYNVSDIDGEISTRFMDFTLDSDRSDDEIFLLQGENVPGQWYWMYVTVSLKAGLNFEENALHIFSVTASDSYPNEHTVTMMVQVENIELRAPRWVEIFAVQQFDEKTQQQFNVRAVDGDTGINRPIYYRIEKDESDTFFHIETIEGGRDGAIFYVDYIDRDTLEREVFQLAIIAYKNDEYDREINSTRANVVIIVNDINDQRPEPFHKEYTINIMEETAMTLNLEEFGFHDRDLGENAQYMVHLEAVFPPNAEEAFYIAPEVGYQRQSFIMGTLNHRLLDFEVPEYQSIMLRVVATDLNNPAHVGIATVYINLINWNDEEPIFEHSLQTVSFKETEGSEFFVAAVRAHDRDIDDRVEHQLLGNAATYLRIDQNTGDVYVSVDDAFDYHRQSELYIQIRADDTLGDGPYHTATSQLIIQLEDVNNTPPTLRLPRGSPHVEENVPEGYLITEEITATDPDTTAELRFEIDWESSYATKQGRETPAVEYHHCVDIETIYPQATDRGTAVGRIVVKEIRPGVTIDYEEFKMLYLTVRVRDLNTVIGEDYDESTFTITIVDMNDNPPVWVEGTLEQEFRVREMSSSGVVIGSVLATDIDGPLYNQVRYTIFTRQDTPEDLVDIDFYTGQITVKQSSAIDADTPPRYDLYYTIIASDQCYAENVEDCPPDPTYWETEGLISIYIIDTNNKIPQAEIELFSTTVYVWENATSGTEIETIISSDLDRDEIYHTVSYQINFAVNPRLRDFFAVDQNTGVVSVHYTTHETLDRDGDEPTHRIFFNLIDNFLQDGDGNTNQDTTEIFVILLDVNDNAPELPTPDQLSWTISENLGAGVRLTPDIYAPGRDEPDTDNSRVGYAILDLTVTNREIELPELFTMIQIQNVTGELETVKHLQGYWGTYDIHIWAYDHGHPQQSSEETYELVIRPYNFHDPVFVFPLPGSTIRLAKERISVNGLLVTTQLEFLERIRATDEDGLHAGIVTFHVEGNAEAVQFFEVSNDGENAGSLILLNTFDEDIREFTVVIRGTDGGTEPGTRHTDCSVRLVFVPTQGEPTFAENTASVAFFELEGGMTEQFQLPLADDPKNYLCGDDCFSTYYLIIDGNADGHFAVNPVTNVIYLVEELDREVGETYTILVAASNSPDSVNALPSNTLTVTVNVREANPRPMFTSEEYMAGISTSDNINRVLLTVQATHSEGAPVTYEIDHSTMIVDPTLEAVKDTAFVLNSQTGVLTLNMQPAAFMHGNFDFKVVATDPSEATDRADVKIYLISSLSRVTFTFRNTLQQINDNVEFIAHTFSIGFDMDCNIDQVVPASDSNGVALDYLTDVMAHFIKDNEPVSAEEIEQLRSDTILLRTIQQTLNMQLVTLEDFVTGASPDISTDSAQIIVYVLIGLTVALSFLCIVLLLTCIIRTRMLNRRLEALSMTRYGSVDSGLNRAGIAAPGTNKHAVEGSNPIWNETIKAPDFDALSDVSNESDLIGIEDMPQFKLDYNPSADDGSLQGVRTEPEPVASHSNNFGFNATPFSPAFGNTPIRR